MNNFELQLGDSLSFSNTNYKNVSWSKSFEAFKELAAKGTFLFEGKPLLVDLFSKVPFFYEVSQEDSENFLLKGKLQMKEVVDLAECRFVAPCSPTWFIYKQQMKVIGTEVSWISLQKLPRLIDQKELDELLQENDPPVHLTFTKAAQKEPLPILQLTDRTGAFANLQMDNGQKDSKAEAYWEKDLLETGFRRKKMERSNFYCPIDKVGKSLSFLLEMGWKILDVHGRELILETKRSLHLDSLQERIVLRGKVEFGDYTADLTQVLGTFNRREQFIDLGSGKIGFLAASKDLESLAEEVELVSSQPTLKRHQMGLIDPTTGWITPPSLKELIEGVQTVENPSGLFKTQLRPYQQQGLAWLHKLYQTGLHGVLADEMGLGKTVQLLAFLSLLKPEARHLIVVPTSLLFNWEREIERFLPSLPHYRHHGLKRAELPAQGAILTSYSTLRADLSLFQDIVWDTIILDEAQLVKNPDTQTAQALYMLKSRFRLVITGTLIENHARELWAHFHFLMPGMLGDRETFEQQLSLTQVDSRYIRKIQKMVHPFILRRKKEEVAKDLPPLDEQITFVEMETSQRQAYDAFLAATRQGLLAKVQLEGEGKQRLQIFEALLRLRQIACHPQLVSQYTDSSRSGKLEALWIDLETIREEGKKALIFSQFASMLHLMASRLRDEGIPYSLLEGATEEREEPVRQFQEDPSIPFFLITLKAGGVGLNLTAADYVLLYDPWWHEAAERQAISRAHRIGQKKPVIVKRYITMESIEEKMLSLKKSKTALFQNLLEGDFADSTLTLEDLNYLLD